jgi:DHA1 family multidrug resistance protein-like MFS transporter
MSIQLRTTLFGQITRLISRGKLFRYPEDLNSSPWRHSIQHDTTAATNSTEIEHNAHGDTLKQVENGSDINLVDWYSPEDPEVCFGEHRDEKYLLTQCQNPRNWSNGWKRFIVLELCILNFAVYMASSIYVPAEKDIMSEFGVSETVATLGLSLFTLGYGIGPMLWSPMSEIPQLGRSRIYVYTLLAFILFQLPVGFANNMAVFLIFRFVTGFCGSPCLSTGGGTIADIYDPVTAASAVCIWASFGIGGPVFGPIIGGYLAPAKGWRWTVWVFTWLCSLVFIIFFFFLPETSAANILYERAKRIRKATGDNRFKSKSEIDAANHTKKDHLMTLGRAFTLTFTEPIVFLMHLYTALVYGLLFIWFESFPFAFGGVYGFSSGQQGLAFLGIFVGALISVFCFILWVNYGVIPMVAKPNFKPELVLPPTFVGSIALPICLFWYGWSAREGVHWIVPIIGTSLFSVGVVTMFNSILNYLGIVYTDYAASIFAGNALFRASFGAVFPLFVSCLQDLRRQHKLIETASRHVHYSANLELVPGTLCLVVLQYALCRSHSYSTV